MSLCLLDNCHPHRLDTLKKNGIEWVKDIGRKNAEDLLTMIQWNEDNVGSSLKSSFFLLTLRSTSDFYECLRRCFHMLHMAPMATPSNIVVHCLHAVENLQTNMVTGSQRTRDNTRNSEALVQKLSRLR